MCGIVGFIGKSTNPKLSNAIITVLLEETQVRGDDATGVWATNSGPKGEIYYHKEPISSSQFVKRKFWREIKFNDLDLMLTHARGASAGVGKPSENKNNHPFVNHDYSLCMVHNGRVPDTDLVELKKKYPTETDCDSEIVLRIFENPELQRKLNFIKNEEEAEQYTLPDKHFYQRMQGLRDVWSYLKIFTHMAVGIGEFVKNGDRYLYLFRNMHRPITVIDMRQHIGQILFCSAPEQWRKTVDRIPELLGKRIPINPIPKDEVWVLYLKNGASVVDNENIHQFSVESTTTIEVPDLGISKKTRVDSEPITKIITGLNNKDEMLEAYTLPVTTTTQQQTSSAYHSPHTSQSTALSTVNSNDLRSRIGFQGTSTEKDIAANDDDTDVIPLSEIKSASDPEEVIKINDNEYDYSPQEVINESFEIYDQKMENVKNLLNDIDVMMKNMHGEGSLSSEKLSEVISEIETIESELNTIKLNIKN